LTADRHTADLPAGLDEEPLRARELVIRVAWIVFQVAFAYYVARPAVFFYQGF
jgi:hypothetical protein